MHVIDPYLIYPPFFAMFYFPNTKNSTMLNLVRTLRRLLRSNQRQQKTKTCLTHFLGWSYKFIDKETGRLLTTEADTFATLDSARDHLDKLQEQDPVLHSALQSILVVVENPKCSCKSHKNKVAF